MISRLVQEKISKEHLSYRQAAKEIGVAHTTLMRIIEGRQIDLPTSQKLAEWLGVTITSLLPTIHHQQGGPDLFNILLQMNPNLRETLEEYLFKMPLKPLSIEDLNDILEFIIFKLVVKIK
ncbi:MAG TPA: helix-turn-helix transcriptional regulator [Anaerolineaceae bacterium]|nr:helix-turn-helix transcriptional regulator [Anaerolineaceae bacterium]